MAHLCTSAGKSVKPPRLQVGSGIQCHIRHVASFVLKPTFTDRRTGLLTDKRHSAETDNSGFSVPASGAVIAT